MSKKIIFLLFAGVLVLAGAGCQGEEKKQTNENNENAQVINGNVNENAGNVNAEEEIVSPEEEDTVPTAGGVNFTSYTNKSVGYTIDRPEKWYWQHSTQKEIGEAMPGVEDLFVTDPNPLTRLGSEYLGRIVIEVSRKSLDELAVNISDLVSSEVTVGGAAAKKFEGTRDNEMVQNQKVIAYHFEKDGRTFRIVYTKIKSTSEEEAVFEHLVSSLSFAR